MIIKNLIRRKRKHVRKERRRDQAMKEKSKRNYYKITCGIEIDEPTNTTIKK